MDKRKNNGGKRESAGRKPKADEIKLIEQLDKYIDASDVFLMLERRIKDDDMKAAQLYMSYRFGKPRETVNMNVSQETPIINLDE
jgi:hypothetical protein